MKSAAIYARVSSEKQKEEGTIGSQIAALVEYAKEEGYAVSEEWVFQDEGYSGSTLVRAGLERVRDLAAEGVIEAVLVYSPDRLSRKYAYQVLLIEELGRQGVEVIFIQSPKATTPEELLLVQFQGMIAEYERAQIMERSRRGKRYRAQAGVVNVLSGAPYGYHYAKKTEVCEAFYQVIEEEAEVVRQVFQLYTREGLTINAIARWLNQQGVVTRSAKTRWERSTVWGMLRNPAYEGKACFGKTERVERQKITRPLRQRGGFSPRSSANRERPRDEWIEIPVPAIVSAPTFALAQEQLQKNKRYARRNTEEPTLLQGMLVCRQCGYAFYRTSTRTSKRKLYYYRCLGSDDYRHPQGRVCQNRPIRQDYLDEVVWKELLQLLENPDLVAAEIQRRLHNIQDSGPRRKRMEKLQQELIRTEKAIEKLVDAYQEGLLQLEELRERIPRLRKRERTLKSELEGLKAATAEKQVFLRLADQVDGFLARLCTIADTLSVTERQKILRLVVKEVQIGVETIKIKHCIPVTQMPADPPSGGDKSSSYLLRPRSNLTAFSQPVLSTLHIGMEETGTEAVSGQDRVLCRRLCDLLSTRSRDGSASNAGDPGASGPAAERDQDLRETAAGRELGLSGLHTGDVPSSGERGFLPRNSTSETVDRQDLSRNPQGDAALEWAQDPRTRGGSSEPNVGGMGQLLLFGRSQQSLSGGGCPHPMEASSGVAAKIQEARQQGNAAVPGPVLVRLTERTCDLPWAKA